MKKIILVLACAFGALALSAQTEKVVFGKMPKNAQEFVQTYFAKENVQDANHYMYLPIQESNQQKTWKAQLLVWIARSVDLHTT